MDIKVNFRVDLLNFDLNNSTRLEDPFFNFSFSAENLKCLSFIQRLLLLKKTCHSSSLVCKRKLSVVSSFTNFNIFLMKQKIRLSYATALIVQAVHIIFGLLIFALLLIRSLKIYRDIKIYCSL